MSHLSLRLCVPLLLLGAIRSISAHEFTPPERPADQTYRDVPFAQEIATIFRSEVSLAEHPPRTVRVDRDGRVLITTDRLLLKGYEGRIVPFRDYAGLADRPHLDLEILAGKFVFLNDKMLLPLHGAGRDYRDNAQSGFTSVAPLGPGKYALLSPAKIAQVEADRVAWQLDNPGYQQLFALANGAVVAFAPDKLALASGGTLTPWPTSGGKITGAIEDPSQSGALLVATDQGLYRVTAKSAARVERKLPTNHLTAIASGPDGRVWMGSDVGAFNYLGDERIHYYAGRRWLADNHVLDITVAQDGSAYILNSAGLTRIEFEPMTLAEKADRYQKHLRLNHIRYGFVSDVHVPDGDYAHTRLHDSDNDGLWSAMYLAAEAYRYSVTGAEDARENALDGLDALERLVTINPIPGFQARSFELDGFAVSDKDRWRKRPEADFEWKGHTSSDELVGTFFCYAVMWDTLGRDIPEVRERIARLVSGIVDHIVRHKLYYVDIDGQPTLWGKWNPEYVNTEMVGGDRRLNSIEILSFLQLAYYMTQDERYRDQFNELVEKHGYAKNAVDYLPDPRGPWNHSDDELYWLTYYNLLQHTFDPKLRETFLQSAREHVEATKRKRNPVWNFIFGGCTNEPIDVAGSAMILREFPLDLRRWRMNNSHRADLEFVETKLRRRRVESVEVIPPDERAIHKWNGNEMSPDGGGNENSAESGAEYLLPYWMGRYFGYITAPQP